MTGNDGSAQADHLLAHVVAPLRQCLRWTDPNIFLLVTLSFVLGIIGTHSLLVVLPQFIIIAAVLLLAGSLFLLYLKEKTGSLYSFLLVLLVFFLLGSLVLVQHDQQPQDAGHIAALIQKRQQVTLVGTLATMVEESTFQRDGEEIIVSRFEINTEEILLHNNRGRWQPVHGRVRLSMQGRNQELQPGMPLMLPAKIGPITNFKTPGVFDYQGYLAAKDIFINGWVLGKRVTVLRDQQEKDFFRTLHALYFLPEQARQQVKRFIRDNLPRPIAGTYQALLIGSRAGVPQDIQEQFKATGTMHLLAISGLHMGLLALMIGTIISRLLKCSEQLLLRTHVPTLTLVAALPILFGYSFIAGMNTPVLRALIMTLVFFSALILRRQHSLLHLLAAAALIVLVRTPLALFTASFQLSFSAVVALLLFLPAILSPSSDAGREQKDRSEHQNWLARLWQGFILPAFLVSLVASLGTLPFMLYHFHRFSLVGPAMNLLVEPFLCFWALPWGLAALPCLFIAPQAAVVLLKIGGLGIRAGLFCTTLGAALPWASVWTITPTTAEILCYGLLLFLWGLSSKRERVQKVVQSIVIVGTGLLMLHFTWGLFFPVRSKNSTVAYLDVGQGTASLLQMANGTRVLIDGGGNRESRRNIGEQVIAPYLWQQRVWRLDQAVITHPHSDHFNGMDFILARFRPKKLFINGDPRVEGKYQEIIEQAAGQGREVVFPRSGEKIVAHGDEELEILSGAEQTTTRRSVNDASLVLRYRHGERSFLFPADISRKQEAALLARHIDLAADVLLAPHHGSRTSSSDAFLVAVDPALIIVSAGKYGERYYPAPVNLAAWKERGIAVAVTREQGTINCETGRGQLRCLDFTGKTLWP